jgi:hypothetical protein
VNAFRSSGDRRQHNVGRRNREVIAMMLPKSDEVDADLVGEKCLLDDVAQDFGVR